MSSTASNYDMSKLVTGQLLAASALILGSIAAWRTRALSFRAGYPLLLLSLLYGIMMFASSYVEEEQHFWYWTTSAWLGMMWLKRHVLLLFKGLRLTNSQLPWKCSGISNIICHTGSSEDCSKMEPDRPKMGWGARYLANLFLQS